MNAPNFCLILKYARRMLAASVIAAAVFLAFSCLNNADGSEGGDDKGIGRKVTLTLYLDDKGQVYQMLSGDPGKPLTPPVDPGKEGRRFAGWEPELPPVYPEKDSPHTAVWVYEGDCVIKYHLDGGTNSAANPRFYNAATPLPVNLSAATKAGFMFGGWYRDAGLTEIAAEIPLGSSGDIELWAKWEPAEYVDYTVEHWKQNTEGDGYTLVKTDKMNGIISESYSVNVMKYEGFTQHGTQEASENGRTVVKVFYNRNIITLKFYLYEGVLYQIIQGRYGAKINLPENPKLDSYEFKNWGGEIGGTFSCDAAYIAQWDREIGNAGSLSGITVTITPTQNDIGNISCQVSGSKLILSVDDTYSSYEWYIDDKPLKSGSGKASIEIDLNEYKGRHEVLVVVDKGYSARYAFEK